MSSLPASHPNSRAGFTLPELLIVIVISAVIVGFTVPAALNFYRTQLVDDTASTLRDTLQRARAYAAAQRNGSQFGVKVLPEEFVLFQGASYATREASLDEHIDYPSVLSVTGTVGEVVFSRLYATSTASGTIMVVGESSSLTVSINYEGKIESQ